MVRESRLERTALPYYTSHTMPILTVRISEKEKTLLAERSKLEGVTAGALIRRMLNEAPLTTSAEVIEDMERRLGDVTLRVRRRK